MRRLRETAALVAVLTLTCARPALADEPARAAPSDRTAADLAAFDFVSALADDEAIGLAHDLGRPRPKVPTPPPDTGAKDDRKFAALLERIAREPLTMVRGEYAEDMLERWGRVTQTHVEALDARPRPPLPASTPYAIAVRMALTGGYRHVRDADVAHAHERMLVLYVRLIASSSSSDEDVTAAVAYAWRRVQRWREVVGERGIEDALKTDGDPRLVALLPVVSTPWSAAGAAAGAPEISTTFAPEPPP